MAEPTNASNKKGIKNKRGKKIEVKKQKKRKKDGKELRYEINHSP
jgi:hypothetical protein